MKDFIIILIIILTVGASVFYIYKKKKSGSKCIGCPYSSACNHCKSSNNTYN